MIRGVGLFRVALTGGIATGKSHCLRRFAELGVPVIDADVVAREAVAPGTLGLAAVFDRFGSTVRAADGTLDRDALGRLVFADPASRKDLEAIVHPIVYQAIEEWFASQARGLAAAPPPFALADIPLLYETNHAADFDRVIVAACTPEQQVERLLARGTLSADDVRQRLAAQWPIAEKRQRAGYVIDTSGAKEDTNHQVVGVWERVRNEAMGQ